MRIFRRRLGLARLLASVLGLGALYASGSIVRLTATFGHDSVVVETVGAIVLVLVANWLVGVPFAIASYRRERAEHLSVQTPASFTGDVLKTLALSLVLAGAAGVAWYAVAARSAVVTVIGSIALAALGTLIGPLLLRAFYRLEPVDDALARRVRTVAERCGVAVDGVLSWRVSEKATIANAAVIGLGPTKQVIIADTLAAGCPPEQLEAVVAHELAHVVHRDTVRGFLVYGGALSVALLLLRLLLEVATPGGAGDPATFPLLVAGTEIIALAASPPVLAYSRSREAAADAFAARHVPAIALADALVWITQRNLGDPDPPRWEEALFMTHPSLVVRLRALGVEPTL